MARLRSDFWVAAYLRQCQIDGLAAVLGRRGADEAGAIFVRVDHLNGTQDLYGPVPQSFAGYDGVRRFQRLLQGDPLTVSDRIDKERRFDADLWLIEVEDRLGRHGLEVVVG
jgi:hypothetical protein